MAARNIQVHPRIPLLAILGAGVLIGVNILWQFLPIELSAKSRLLMSGLMLAVNYSYFRNYCGLNWSQLRQVNSGAIGVVLLFVAKVLHDAYHYVPSQGVVASGIYIFTTFVEFGTYVLLCASFSPGGILVRAVVFGIALTVYVATNVIAYTAGVMPEEMTYRTHVALGSVIGERMVAPFSSGLNGFGSFASLATAVCAATLIALARERLKTLAICMAVGSGVACLAIFMVQIRSSLFVLMVVFGFGLISILHSPIRQRIVASCFAIFLTLTMVGLPAAFIGLKGVDYLEALLPQQLEYSMGRNAYEMIYLGGRVYIWDYGWTLAGEGTLGLTGQGLAQRDSSPVLAIMMQGASEVRMSYHNGWMELLIVYGPIFALCIVAWLIFTMVRTQSSRAPDSWLGMALVGAAVATCYLEAFSVVTAFWGIWLCSITTFAPPSRAS